LSTPPRIGVPLVSTRPPPGNDDVDTSEHGGHRERGPIGVELGLPEIELHAAEDRRGRAAREPLGAAHDLGAAEERGRPDDVLGPVVGCGPSRTTEQEHQPNDHQGDGPHEPPHVVADHVELS
jgi:hypothetical protein